jgi:hypothetical protein
VFVRRTLFFFPVFIKDICNKARVTGWHCLEVLEKIIKYHSFEACRMSVVKSGTGNRARASSVSDTLRGLAGSDYRVIASSVSNLLFDLSPDLLLQRV